MELSAGAVALTGLSWAWDKFGEAITKKGTDLVKDKWSQQHWSSAEGKYRERVFEQVSTTLLLGYPKPINVNEIYTDVYVLDGITAKRKFDFDDLTKSIADFDFGNLHQKRTKAEDLLSQSKRIFILGKPGAGKTTFLKYLAILCCQGNIHKTPIYISLKEWSDSGIELNDYIEKQFNICGFQDAKPFVNNILLSGEALILFDGLDEVNQEAIARAKMIITLSDFAKSYSKCSICLTCRVAATDYTFTQFTYVEIADFDKQQTAAFIKNWYQNDTVKLGVFRGEWEKEESAGFRDLGQTPLLLALLCLAFDETLQFAKRRVDLYGEATDALLKKWDSSRGILRAEVYRKLSLNRKKQLLSRLAANNFEKGNYLLRKQILILEIEKFLTQIPPEDRDSEPDAENILSAIEYQHGLLVERAHGIYSFSHLTFQEFFTAKYFVDNQSTGTLSKLIEMALVDLRWREVVLMCSSLLDDATHFIQLFSNKLWLLIESNKAIVSLIDCIENDQRKKNGFANVFSIESIQPRPAKIKATKPDLCRSDIVVDKCLELAAEFSFGKHDIGSPGYDRAHRLAILLHQGSSPSTEHQVIIDNFFLDKKNSTEFANYLNQSKLLVECLRISWVDDRAKLTNMVLKTM